MQIPAAAPAAGVNGVRVGLSQERISEYKETSLFVWIKNVTFNSGVAHFNPK